MYRPSFAMATRSLTTLALAATLATGTAANAASLVADINTFANPDRSPFGMATTNVSFGNRVWYAARATMQGETTLWSSNLQGTRALGGQPAKYTGVRLAGATNAGVFFSALRGSSTERAIHVTDGVSTQALMMIGDDDVDPSHIQALGSTTNGTVFAVRRTDAMPEMSSLYVTDGTSGGTRLIADIAPIHDSTGGFFEHRGFAYFFTASSGTAVESATALWRTDGTPAGTSRIKSVGSSRFIHSGMGITTLGNEIFFQAMGPNYCRLWRSDGTRDGTVIIDRIGSVDDTIAWCPGEMTSRAPDLVYYKKIVNGKAEVWRHIRRMYAPSSSGRVYTAPTTGDTASQIRNMLMFNDGLWFSGLNWQSKPSLVRHNPINMRNSPTISITSGYRIEDIVTSGNKMVFSTSTGPSSLKTWLHESNGTNAGTREVTYIRGNIESDLVSLNGLVTFQGSNAADQHQVFGVVPNASSLMRLSNFEGASLGSKAVATEPVAYSSSGRPGVPDRAVFCAIDTSNGRHALWSSNGTESGTIPLIRHIGRDTTKRDATTSPYPACGSFTVLNDKIYYAREFDSPGAEMWSASVWGANQKLLFDIPNVESRPKHIMQVSGNVIASVKTKPQNRTLIKINTSSSGYQVLNNAILNPIPIAHDELLAWFAVAEGGNTSNITLWQTDGTKAGTFAIARNLRSVQDVAVSQGRRFILGTDSRRNSGLFALGYFDDRLITPRQINTMSSQPGDKLVSFGGSLIMNVGAGVNRSLWKSDGTPVGTNLVLRTDRHILDLKVAGDSLWFGQLSAANEANASATGWQLMRSDGSEAGTYVVHEENFQEPRDVDAPGTLVEIGSTLLFYASTQTQGVELWGENRLSHTNGIRPPGS